MIDAILGLVNTAFQARQSKREQDKAARANRLAAAEDARLQTEALSRQRTAVEQSREVVGGGGPTFVNNRNFLPIAIIGGIALVGVVLLKR